MFFDKFSTLTFVIVSGLSFGTASLANNNSSTDGYSFQQQVIFYTTKIPAQCVRKERPLVGAHALIGIDTEAC